MVGTDRKILIFGIFAVFMMVLWPFIQSICLALLMSTVLAEAVEWFQHKCKLRRDLSAFLVSLAFSLGIILPLIILTGSLITQ